MKKSIVQQIAALPSDQKALVPEIKVEIEPVFEVTTPAPDMQPIADMIAKLVNVNQFPSKEEVAPVKEIQKRDDKKPEQIKVDVAERDGRGLIKTLLCTNSENSKQTKIEVERSGRGFVESFLCTEINNG